MSDKMKSFGPSGIIVLVFAALAFWLPGLLKTDPTATLVLRIGLMVFGAIIAGITFILMRSREREKALATGGAGDDIDNAITTAQQRLAASRLAAKTKIDRFPSLSYSVLAGAQRHQSSRTAGSMPNSSPEK